MTREKGPAGAVIDNAVITGDAYYRASSYRRALRAYMKAGSIGTPAALVRLGYMVEHGHGTPVNKTNARKLYQMAADEDDPAGEFFLGRFYYLQGTEEARKSGIQLIRKSAAKAYPPALYMLGAIYAEGAAVEADPALARRYFDRAAAQGHLFARMTIAKLKMAGRQGARTCVSGAVEYVAVMIDAVRIVCRGGQFSPLVLR